LAVIDNMVTVVDAFRFWSEFDTAEYLSDRYSSEELPEEDSRTISDLLVDQIEFANVIILNKSDMVDAKAVGKIKAFVRQINVKAEIIEAKYSKVDVKQIINTKKFDFAEVTAAQGWLASLQEMWVMDVHGKKRKAPKPETLE
jgi:G3E family GTPase